MIDLRFALGTTLIVAVRGTKLNEIVVGQLRMTLWVQENRWETYKQRLKQLYHVSVDENEVTGNESTHRGSKRGQHDDTAKSNRLDDVLPKIERTKRHTKLDVLRLVVMLQVRVGGNFLAFHPEHLDGFIVEESVQGLL